eukprot:Skav202072  [mRNA]  locus=scaffold1138:758631:772677:- [translate_table: standard]
MWSHSKRLYCCWKTKTGCPHAHTVYHTRTVYHTKEVPRKVEMPPEIIYKDVSQKVAIDCNSGYSNWYYGWSSYKKHYCCDKVECDVCRSCSVQAAGCQVHAVAQDPYDFECASEGCQSTMMRWFFQWAFCTAGATIVSGAVAERVKSPTYAAFAFFMTSFIYPVVVAWTWGGGWLSKIFDVGYIDFAGVVHLCGGVAGLAGTYILGPRTGRFTNPDAFECHNLPLVVLGTFALWFGWYGFNPGSTLTMKSGGDGALAAQVAMNTTLAAAAGGITVFVLRYVSTKMYDVGALCNGILTGLVSITAGCGNMESGSAVATGVVGGLVYQAASMLLQKLKIDDPVDASPVHGFCGAWGVVAAGLFDWGKGIDHFHGWSGFGCMEHDEDSGKSGCRTGIGGPAIGAQFIMVLMIVLWSGTLSSIGFLFLKKTGFLRISEEVEEVGMDTHRHSPPKAYNFSEASLSSKFDTHQHSTTKKYNLGASEATA